jgi:hypothetical protein
MKDKNSIKKMMSHHEKPETLQPIISMTSNNNNNNFIDLKSKHWIIIKTELS